MHFQIICLAAVLAITSITACGPSSKFDVPLDEFVREAPEETLNGSLYPRINAYLVRDTPDILAAIRDVRTWANANLDGFREGICAQTQVVSDAEFAHAFGKTTLGVTLPWMQIFIRDGHREQAPYLWKDPSLLASTVLHEYVHSAQRVRQARALLESGASCNEARAILLQRRSIWNAAFEDIKSDKLLDSRSYAPAERTLVYRWSSPIERAHDEIEAATLTVKWMSQYPGELNALTLGGANNWAYAVGYLYQMRLLAATNCFSPEDGAFEEEKHIYQDKLPRLTRDLGTFEPAMRGYIKKVGLSIVVPSIDEATVAVAPLGRSGARCTSGAMLGLPTLPIDIHFAPLDPPINK